MLLATLTPREHQVFELIVRGKMNKQIGHELGATERTIKAHRQKVMQKMKVRSLAELVSIADDSVSRPSERLRSEIRVNNEMTPPMANIDARQRQLVHKDNMRQCSTAVAVYLSDKMMTAARSNPRAAVIREQARYAS